MIILHFRQKGSSRVLIDIIQLICEQNMVFVTSLRTAIGRVYRGEILATGEP